MDGTDITYRAPNQRNVGMVFQSYALFPNMTVADNIGFGLKVRKKPKADIARRVEELIALMHLEGRAGRFPYQMSGGQQQRVALARALAIEPQVLLLDEPLSALDAKIRIVLRKEIRSIQRQLGITTVYVTHDQEEALSLSDRVVVMSDGNVEQIGTPSEIYNFPATPFVASFVGTLNLVPAGVIDPATGRVSVGGQEIRTSKAITDARAGDRITLALRPEGIGLGEGDPGENRLRGTIDDISFLGSIVRLRLSVEGDAGAAPSEVSLDTFNEPHLALPPIGGARDRVVPAGGVLRPGRLGRGGRAGARGGRRRGVTGRSDPLDGIDLVVFDKDGTLIGFGTMWSDWAIELGTRLSDAVGRDVRGPLDAMLGFDPVTGAVSPHGGLAATPMARLREMTLAVLAGGRDRRSRRRTRRSRVAWHAPDPEALAQPLADLRPLLARIRATRPTGGHRDERRPRADGTDARGAGRGRPGRCDRVRRRRHPGQARAGHGPAALRGMRRGARARRSSSATRPRTCAWGGRPGPAWWSAS